MNVSYKLTEELKERWHGTSGGYTNHDCRCQGCRKAWAVRVANYRKRRFADETSLDCCQFGGCVKRDMLERGLCSAHYNMMYNLVVVKKIRTWEEIELTKK